MQTLFTDDDAQRRTHQRFTEMLPTIQRYADRGFRKCHRELRDELVAATVADAYVAFARLVERGRETDAHATVLANYSIRRVAGGIKVGTPRNQDDVLSRYSRLRTGARIESLHRQDCDGKWNELVVEDRRHGCPAETASLRLDIADWLRQLSGRDRLIAWLLAVGERTCDVAARFGLSSSRVAQLRKKLARSWRDFHGFEPSDPEFGWLAEWEAA